MGFNWSKIFSRITWFNGSERKSTPITAQELNRLETAIDELDNRVVQLANNILLNKGFEKKEGGLQIDDVRIEYFGVCGKETGITFGDDDYDTFIEGDTVSIYGKKLDIQTENLNNTNGYFAFREGFMAGDHEDVYTLYKYGEIESHDAILTIKDNDGIELDAGSSTITLNAGDVEIMGQKFPEFDGEEGQVLSTDGNGHLEWIDNDVSALSEDLSDAYNSGRSYAAGDFCIYNSSLYRCKAACNNVAPTNTDYWVKTNVGNEVSALKNSLNNKVAAVDVTITDVDNWSYGAYPNGFNKDNCFVAAIGYKDSGVYRYGIGAATGVFTRLFVKVDYDLAVYNNESTMIGEVIRVILQKF